MLRTIYQSKFQMHCETQHRTKVSKTATHSLRKTALSLTTVLGITLASPFGISNTAMAQTGALEEIIVTANKRSESLQNVPIAVTAFDAELIQAAGINNASDVAILTPSLTITVNTQPFTAAFRIRGVGTSQTDIALEPSVGLFVDDVYLGRSGLGMSDLTDIERIEVLQGPQGTLYGKNTNAGAVNIITKAPNLEEFEGYIETSLGNFDLRKITVGASGPVREDLAFRLSGNIHQRDGYIENTAGTDLNAADDWNLIGKLLYQPTDSLSFLLNASHVDRDTNCCGADTRQTEVINQELEARGLPRDESDPFDYKVAVDRASEFLNEADTVSLVVDYDQDWGSLKSITAWGESSGSATRDVDITQLDVFYQEEGVSSGDYQSQELRFSSDTSAAVEYQLGAFYYESTTNGGNNMPWTFVGEDLILIASQTESLGALLPAGIPIDFVTQPGDSIRALIELETETLATFGQTTWHISDRWDVTGGLRWTKEKKRADILVAVDSTAASQLLTGESLLTRVTTPIDENFSRSQSVTNWRLNSSYHINDDSMLYASVATGSKSGGFNTVNGAIDDREFDDESTIAYELGIKSTMLAARLRINAAAFYSEIDDYQFQQQLESGIGSRVSSQGEVETSGLDINLEALPLPNLTITAGLLYMHRAKVTGGPQEGADLPFTAEFSGNLSATLVYPLADGGLYLRADYSYMDEHVTNASVNTDEDDLQERHLLNLNTGWRNDRWNLSLWAKNLNDDAYAGLTAATLPLTGMDAFFLAPPRTYGATLRYNF